MAELKALIFDVDGTLAETERDGHRIAFNETFKNHLLDWFLSYELYGELLAVTGGKERMKFYLQRYQPKLPQLDDLDAFIAMLHKEKTALYNQIVATGQLPLRLGIKRLLLEAQQAGLTLAIATTTSPENVATLLQHSLAPDAVSWFRVIAAGDVVPAKKPAPDIYNYALQQLDLPPENCIAFEDTANGLKSALGAKIHPVITISYYSQNEQFTGAPLVVDHLGEADIPCNVLSGQLNSSSYVNVAALRHLATSW
jgi:HAD superfamily hydrolase (TIGR01509 family)